MLDDFFKAVIAAEGVVLPFKYRILEAVNHFKLFAPAAIRL